MKLFKKDFYEQLFAKKDKTVSEYHLLIQEMQAKIAELQAKCEHTEFDVAMYSWRPGAMQPSKVCRNCCVYLGEASQEESEQAWKAFYGSHYDEFKRGSGVVMNSSFSVSGEESEK